MSIFWNYDSIRWKYVALLYYTYAFARKNLFFHIILLIFIKYSYNP